MTKTIRLTPILLALSVAARPAAGAWPHHPAINLPVCTAANDQDPPAIVSDGAGGAFVAWHDGRSGGFDIYAQHLLASGAVDPAWPANGRAVCSASNTQQYPRIVADGAGGAIVTWHDARGGTSYDIYAQRVLASGAVDPAWPLDGRALCIAAGHQQFPAIAPDGAGGALVTWWDARSGLYDIYTQRVLASGAVDPAWPADGRALCTAAGNQQSPAIVADGAGGAIVAWQDDRSGGPDIYAQRVRASGVVDPAWPTDGRALGSTVEIQELPAIVADGAGGAIVAWQDARNGTLDIYAQHVLASGAVDGGWPANGRALCSTAGSQKGSAMATDGAGGAIVAWEDFRGTNYDIYAQHVLGSGQVDGAWPLNGRALCTTSGTQQFPVIDADGAGGAFVAWHDARSGGYDIYAQRVLASGAVDPAWPLDGRALCTASGTQQFPALVADGTGGAVVAWQDSRSGGNDLYSQRVARFGYLGTPEAEIFGVADVPNDQGGKVKLSWHASWLDTESDPNLSAYDIYRSVPPNVVAEALRRGARQLASPAEAVTPGSRAFLTTVEGATEYAWEYLASQTAMHYLFAYSYLAPTTGDSTGAYNPPTAFMIVARDASGSYYWLSRPESGYSVDNLPPDTPAPFTGNYGAGATHLHWDPNTEPDLAHYRLYRGSSEDFVPAPANRIAAPADTGYADPGPAGSYYKLSAVDVHGNESGFALLTPAGTTDISGGALPAVVSLAHPVPNPAQGEATLRFDLPRAARVSLGIYDVGGRRVRELARGVLSAGEHVLAWNGLDDSGTAVRSGIYLVRLEAEGRALTRKLVRSP